MNHRLEWEESIPNWSRFYQALNRLGPIALKQIPKDWVRWLQIEGETADWFWSQEIEYCLFSLWGESPERAVEEALSRYVESVQRVLEEFPFTETGPGWKIDGSSGERVPRSDCIASITCYPVRPRILRVLVDAASQP